ncbi:hypothetical protein AB0M43_36560 [Longispora sp. NPDC051575]|uniref:hypothetical protein n=1 Tax=Longispora sp. NPDC051575 TaxID=3154943 RepID=UPI003430D3F2
MRDDLTREHRVRPGVPTDELADLLWIFTTGYVPDADAMIVREADGAMRITPDPVAPAGTEAVVTRRHLAEIMLNTGATPGRLRNVHNARVLAVVIWSMR